MPLEIGHVEAIFRYPVKSMRGEPLEVAELGWHGIEGDRRMAFRRVDDRSGFPWLTATELPALLMFSPFRSEERSGGLSTHVRTPDGQEMPVLGEELAREIVTFAVDGITLSGGEPFSHAHALSRLLEDVRTRRPELTVLCFTGFLMESLARRDEFSSKLSA